jgi:moderate conductance mechanosensitive channel
VNTHDLQVYLAAHAGPFLVRLVTAVVVAAAVYVGARIAARLLTRALHERSGRAQTIAPILRGMVILVGTLLAVIMAMAQLGVDVTTVLAGAGIVGLAVGFGAQTLVKDCISGFFLIIDDVIEIGDLVEIEKIFGRVEKVGLRVTKIREYNGKLWYVPNGSITTVANLSREFTRVLADVGIAYEADVGRGLEVLAEIGDTWAEENPKLALESPKAQGVIELADSAVKLRLVAKVPPGTVAQEVARELRRRIKDGFDAAGLEIPYPTSVQYERSSHHDQEEQPSPS